MTPKLGTLALVLACVASTACSSSVLGTGDDPTQTQKPTDPAGEVDGEQAPAEVEKTASGAPLEIEALFLPPKSTATPDSLFGVWARSAETVDTRIQISGSTITFAQKCMEDGLIIYVTVAARATAADITVLETKTAKFAYPARCYLQAPISLSISELKACHPQSSSATVGCFFLDGKKLEGLPDVYDEWLKLSD